MGLRPWNTIGASVDYGATIPETGVSLWLPLGGEVLCTFLLVVLIFLMAAHRRTQPWTPLVNPPLFALLVWLESPLSGSSANPARSIGPALIAGLRHGQWIYIAGPCAGAAFGTLVMRYIFSGRHRPTEARLFHFHRRPHDAILNPCREGVSS